MEEILLWLFLLPVLKLQYGRESSLCVWKGLRKYKPVGVMVWTPEQKSIKEMRALRSFVLEVEKAERLMWPFHKEAVSRIIICCGANWLKMAGQGWGRALCDNTAAQEVALKSQVSPWARRSLVQSTFAACCADLYLPGLQGPGVQNR